jgi:NADPH2:quinone reductase
MEQYGSPEVLVHAAAELPDLGPCEVRIRTRFAAVNYTDLHIRSGDWPIRKQPPFPYTPGVEAVGIIEAMGTDVDDWQVGQSVITMMQGLGGVRAERPGSYADFVTVDSNALAGIPGQVAPADMAALGLAGVTAFEGLRKLGPLDGRRIAITGAAGGVGSAATAIARGLGASVLALVTNTGDVDYVRKLGATDAIVVAKGAKPAVELQTCDGVLDTVGGPLFGPCVDALSDGGVLCLVGAVAGGDVAFDAWQLVRPVTITGYSTETLDGAALQRTVNALAALLDRKAIAIPDYRIMPLHQAAHAHALLEQRHVRGRILLQP